MAWVVFFDGSCGLCRGSVKKIHQLDKEGLIDFAPLQGDLATQLGLESFAGKTDGTMVLVSEEQGRRFYRSDAVIEIGKLLGAPWSWFAALGSLLPARLRDRAYRLVARNRHRLMKKRGACEIPDESLRQRIRE